MQYEKYVDGKLKQAGFMCFCKRYPKERVITEGNVRWEFDIPVNDGTGEVEVKFIEGE